MFIYLHFTNKVLSLSSVDLNNMPFSRNLNPMLDKSLLYLNL
jgi:hypothetical protein